MPCSIPPSQLTNFIAKMLGKAEAYVIKKVNEEINKIVEQLLGQVCPPVEEIERILKVRDNLVDLIQSLQKKIEPINKVADNLEPPVQAASTVVEVLKTIPIPTTIGTPPGPAGGVVFSIPIGAQNRYAELLRLSCLILEMLKKDISAIRGLTSITVDKVDPLLEKLKSIDIKLASCVEDLNEDDRNRILAGIINLPSNLALSAGGGSDNNLFYYKNYTIKVVEDKESPAFAKRRFAQVENVDGVVLMRGPASFSSSTKVLVDEIKFRINNQLP